MEAPNLTLNETPRHGGELPLHHPQRRRSLLLWSGGVDSTYSLLRLLRTTSDHVFTHHVRINGGNGRERGQFEGAALQGLRACLSRRERSFTHTTSSLDLSELGGRSLDSSILAFMAAQAAMTHALTPFDRIVIGVNGDCDPGWNPDSLACALRRSRMARALRAAWGCDEVPQIYLWLPRPLRPQMIGTLGAELYLLTASCSQPEHEQRADAGNVQHGDDGGVTRACDSGQTPELRACGRCAKCRMRTGAQQDNCHDGQRSNDDDRRSNGDVARGAAARTPHLFHHLEQLSNKRRGLLHEAAASDPPEP